MNEQNKVFFVKDKAGLFCWSVYAPSGKILYESENGFVDQVAMNRDIDQRFPGIARASCSRPGE